MSDSDGRCQGCTIVGLERTDTCERFTKLILCKLLGLVSKQFQKILSTMSRIVQSGLDQQWDRDVAGSNLQGIAFSSTLAQLMRPREASVLLSIRHWPGLLLGTGMRGFQGDMTGPGERESHR